VAKDTARNKQFPSPATETGTNLVNNQGLGFNSKASDAASAVTSSSDGYEDSGSAQR